MNDRAALGFLLFLAGLVASGEVLGQGGSVDVEIFNTASAQDDYVCWSPAPVRIRSAVASATARSITIETSSVADGGTVLLHPASPAPRPDSDQFVGQLTVTLPAGGQWVTFWVAGSRASSQPRDVTLRVQASTGETLAEAPLMVRVRKDAGTLTIAERDRFLAALRQLHDLDNASEASQFTKYALLHQWAFHHGIHHGSEPTNFPLFLAWHRAFLLNLERELQEIDASIAIPYWRFDLPDGSSSRESIFSTDFMGSVDGQSSIPGGFIVAFSDTNPLRQWAVPEFGALTRGRNGAQAPISDTMLNAIFEANEANGTPLNAAYLRANGALETRYHNLAHSTIAGWLGRRYSPADPLFFLLHANVDRGWALWQARFDRFDPSGPESYSVQGTYPGAPPSKRYRRGSFAQDVMWPWASGGGAETEDEMDDWPGDIKLTLPDGPVVSASQPPTPASMVDSMGMRDPAHALHVCYDDVPYRKRGN